MKLNATPESFDLLFDECVKNCTTYQAAYEAAEEEHIKLTGHRRYSDYESYRGSRNRRIKNKKIKR